MDPISRVSTEAGYAHLRLSSYINSNRRLANTSRHEEAGRDSCISLSVSSYTIMTEGHGADQGAVYLVFELSLNCIPYSTCIISTCFPCRMRTRAEQS